MMYDDIDDEIFSQIIDFRVQADIYLYEGWTEVNLPRQPRDMKVDIQTWCDSNSIICYGRGQRWMFKNQKDAVFFSLRWV